MIIPLVNYAVPLPHAKNLNAISSNEMREKAKELETVFLSEMLNYAGLKPLEGEFSGGIGESQLSSFLRNEQAQAIVSRGGLGLAPIFFESMKGHRNDAS